MDDVTISTNVHFCGVGQGLFVRGSTLIKLVRASAESQSEYTRTLLHWVYDCGSTDDKLVIDKVNSLAGADQRPQFSERAPDERPILDFVVISHFDCDHIRGLSSLLKAYKVKRIFLPYHDPLAILGEVFSSLDESARDVDPRDLIQAWTDPVAYIRRIQNGGTLGDSMVRADDDPTKIIYVPYSDDPAPERGNREPQYSDSPEPVMAIRRPQSEEVPSSQDADVSILTASSNVVWCGVWEFVPYVDPQARQALLSFKPAEKIKLDAQLEKIKTRSNDPKETEERLWEAILDLKLQFYKAVSRKKVRRGRSEKVSPREKNVISLMAYLGAVPSLPSGVWARIPDDKSAYPPQVMPNVPGWVRHHGDGALFTGDGFLRGSKDISKLVRFLGVSRIENTVLLQVPHHGSGQNGSKFTQDALNTPINVFCANPSESPYHPDTAVVDAFATWKDASTGYRQALRVLVNRLDFSVRLVTGARAYPGYYWWV
ncbi:hypothetical protein [Dyella nitratireducens]|uniref:Metallo-beta-lactamase domain-containing protein n=1 Tax=Dyella nitratireducens TaxID=1849580 RepID=A0ABQ1GCP4_9GAMM|nr:hypothetical protein [Dyella nitratireducens]GGA41126.1 hypothetical protein GCM10010981_32910 [Dyella nitratireducens]GLQ40649.1 hypothetical protein GCM10007902_04980 [Dyella nitratireducens]